MFAFKVNLCTLGYSISVGWTASSFLIYDSDDSPLPTGRLSMDELAWIGSILGIGGLFGTVIVGWICDCVGRKNSLLALAIPQIVSFRAFFQFHSIVFDMAHCECHMHVCLFFFSISYRSVFCLSSTLKTCIIYTCLEY